jgi:HK97 gp10 family phage protein
VQKDGNEVEGLVGTNVEYAPYVEAGTSRQTAKPFLKPAGDENRDRILQLFQGLI